MRGLYRTGAARVRGCTDVYTRLLERAFPSGRHQTVSYCGASFCMRLRWSGRHQLLRDSSPPDDESSRRTAPTEWYEKGLVSASGGVEERDVGAR